MLARTHAPLSSAIGATAYATYVIDMPSIPNFWQGGFDKVLANFEELFVNFMHGVSQFTPTQLATMVVIVTTVGGFAIFPDLDEPGATIVKKTGVIGEVISRTISPLVGGHRKGTHSFLFGVPIVAGIGALAALNPISFAILCAFAFYLAASLLFGSSKFGTITKVVLTVALFVIALNAEVTPLEGALLAGGGAGLHVIEDCFTKGKTYILWTPFWEGPAVHLNLFYTGRTFEKVVLNPIVMVYFTFIFATTIIYPSLLLVSGYL